MSQNSNRNDSNKVSRRQFVLGSSVAVTSALVAGNLGVVRGTHIGGDDAVRIALVGCGGRGTGAAIQALSTKSANVRLVAMADAFRDRLDFSLQRIRKRVDDTWKVDVPEQRRFVGIDAYQKAIDCGVDAVLLVTPPGFRPVQFEAAVKAGKHVFMEKPVAVDAPGVRSILATSKEADKKKLSVAVGFTFRHEINHIECVKMIQDGATGDVTHMRALYCTAGVWVRPRMTDQTELEYQLRNWYYFNWLSGDHIVEQHQYTLHLVNWLKGDMHPIECHGMGGRQVRTGKDYGEIFDHHANEYLYPDGSRLSSFCRHMPGCWNSGYTVHAYGTKGHADMKNARDCAIYIKGQPPKVWGKGWDGYQVEHDDLFASIVRGEPYNEAPYDAHATMTAIMGRMATYSGQVITWNEAINSQQRLGPEHLTWDTEPPVKPGPDGIYPCAVPGVTKVI